MYFTFLSECVCFDMFFSYNQQFFCPKSNSISRYTDVGQLVVVCVTFIKISKVAIKQNMTNEKNEMIFLRFLLHAVDKNFLVLNNGTITVD